MGLSGFLIRPVSGPEIADLGGLSDPKPLRNPSKMVGTNTMIKLSSTDNLFPSTVPGFEAMDVTKPYKFIGFEAVDVTKPYKFIGFEAMDVTKPFKFIGFEAVKVTKP